MKTKFLHYPLMMLTVIGLLQNSCSSTSKATGSKTSSASTTKVVTTTDADNNLSLASYLRRVPGVQVDQRGSDVSVMIRGMSSIGSNNQPLFVVNGAAIGNSYQDAVSSVDVNDIKTINVIQGTEGQQSYGMRGANGVIQIITKSATKAKAKKK